MWGWCIVTFASARLKGSVWIPPLRGMYQRGGTCKGCDMRTLRHEAATAQQQLQFYQAQHPTTTVPDDFSPPAEDDEDTEQEDDTRMEILPYQEDELDSDDEEMAQSINRLTYDLTIPLPYGPTTPPPTDSTLIANKA